MSSSNFNPGAWAETLIGFAEQEGNGSLFKEWISKGSCHGVTLEESQNNAIYKHDYNNDDIRYSLVSQAFSDLIDRLSQDGNNDLIKRIVEFLYAFKDGRESYSEKPSYEDCETFGALYSIFDSIEQTNKTKFNELDASIKTLNQQKISLSDQANHLTKQNNQCEKAKENLTNNNTELTTKVSSLTKEKSQCETQQQKLIQERSSLEDQISKLTEQSKILCKELDETQFAMDETHHPCTQDII
ncbi:MAG: hypothetical protein U0X86_000308 [Wolbachia endosymbiont of Xenopsylla cheopis]